MNFAQVNFQLQALAYRLRDHNNAHVWFHFIVCQITCSVKGNATLACEKFYLIYLLSICVLNNFNAWIVQYLLLLALNTMEEIEKYNFSLKTDRIFSVHTTLENLKTKRWPVNLDLCLRKTRPETHYDYRNVIGFEKLKLLFLINKLTSVFLCVCPVIDHGNFVITLSKKLWIHDAIAQWIRRLLWQCYEEIHD